MKKSDLVLIAAVLLIAAAILLFGKIYYGGQDGKLYVQVVVGQEVVDTLPLDADCSREYTTEDGVNYLVISGGVCFVQSADCYNQVCVQTGEISEVGEAIVCMPHKLAVNIIAK